MNMGPVAYTCMHVVLEAVMTPFAWSWLEKYRADLLPILMNRKDANRVLVLSNPEGPRIGLIFPGTKSTDSPMFDRTIEHDEGVVIVECPPGWRDLFFTPEPMEARERDYMDWYAHKLQESQDAARVVPTPTKTKSV